MLTGIHVLLTYSCTYECDHCFLYCRPAAPGTFTFWQLQELLKQTDELGTVEWIYFEGGEPFLYYPLLIKAVSLAQAKGYQTGIVSNAYWATTVEDAEIWLEPLSKLGLADLSLSDDDFHSDNPAESPAKKALSAAKKLNVPVETICIEASVGSGLMDERIAKGEPIVAGSVRFRGRAAEKLTQDGPRRPLKELTTCLYEDLEHPSRVHVDSYGHVHLCQGLLLGNVWKEPLSDLFKKYDPTRHPICAPLIQG
ncbi:MAG: radical SAM protein, partial [bacterium]